MWLEMVLENQFNPETGSKKVRLRTGFTKVVQTKNWFTTGFEYEPVLNNSLVMNRF